MCRTLLNPDCMCVKREIMYRKFFFYIPITTVRMGLLVAAALGVKVSNNMEYTRSYVSI